MKTTLFYFTGTGNSLKIARDLAEALGDTVLLPIPRVMNQASVVTEADNVGIVFPVYMWGLPLIVERFAKMLNITPGQYLFGVANYGGFQAGTLLQLKKTFAERNITLSAGFGVKMPGNYTPMYGAKPIEQQQKFFNAEKKRVLDIAAQVKNRSRRIEKDFFLTRLVFSTVIYRMGAPHIPGMDKDLFADDKCNKCGICAKVCPVNNITLVDGKPQWQHRCEQCLACLQWCPQEAIQMGKNTAGRKRYHHPDVKIADMLESR